MARRYQYRTCSKCNTTKLYLEFDKYRTKNQRKPACRACTRVKIAGNGPHPAPEPCVGCGKTFEVDGPFSRAKLRKACSAACAHASMRKQMRPCQQCHQILPYEDFERKAGARTRRLTCKNCAASLAQQETHSVSPAPYIFLSLAHSINKGNCVSSYQATIALAGGCVTCGDLATHLVLLDRYFDWSKDNIQAMCYGCAVGAEALGKTVSGPGDAVVDFIRRHESVRAQQQPAEVVACQA